MCHTMKTQKSLNYGEELSLVSRFLSVEDVLSYVEYAEQGDFESAKKVISDRAGYISAVFETFLDNFRPTKR